MLIPRYQQNLIIVLLCTLLFQNCQSQTNALQEEVSPEAPPGSVTSDVLTRWPMPELLPSGPPIHTRSMVALQNQEGLATASSPPLRPTVVFIFQPPIVQSAGPNRSSNSNAPVSPTNKKTFTPTSTSSCFPLSAASPPSTTVKAIPKTPYTLQQTITNVTPILKMSSDTINRLFATSSGEHIRLQEQDGQWQVLVQSAGLGHYAPQQTLPVAAATGTNIASVLSWLQGQAISTSKARIYIIPMSPQPPYNPCVYLGKLGLLGGRFDGARPKAQIPTMAFGRAQWRAHFGVDVGAEPTLPENINRILEDTCPFRLEGENAAQRVRDNHLLVLIPANVDGLPFTLNKLGELIKLKMEFANNDYGYRYYESSIRKAFGHEPLLEVETSYWLLMTREVLEGSLSTSYSDQQAMVDCYSNDGYRLPCGLEAATCILANYARSGVCKERLFGDNPRTYTRCAATQLVDMDRCWPLLVGGFELAGLRVDSGYDLSCHGVACCRNLSEVSPSLVPSEHANPGYSKIPVEIRQRIYTEVVFTNELRDLAFGKQAWAKYFGGVDVGEEPPISRRAINMLNSPCPFMLEGENAAQRVKDNHVLVLIPATVDGVPFTLNKLGELIKRRFSENSSGYRYYNSSTRKTFGHVPLPEAPYWLLMTCKVLEGSLGASYSDQQAMVKRYNNDSYRLPYGLEAATCILAHYVHSGVRRERLFGNNSLIYTRCTAMQLHDRRRPLLVGGFELAGLGVDSGYDLSCHGVACCRKL